MKKAVYGKLTLLTRYTLGNNAQSCENMGRSKCEHQLIY